MTRNRLRRHWSGRHAAAYPAHPLENLCQFDFRQFSPGSQGIKFFSANENGVRTHRTEFNRP